MDLDRPVVRAIYCRLLVELLAEEGLGPRAVLTGTGLAVGDLAESDALISYAQQLRIYENALSLSARPGLGYRFGRRQRISDHGVFGYAIQSSADLAQALRILVHYQATTGPLMAIAVEVSSETASIVLRERLPLGAIGRLAREEIIVVITQRLLALTDPPSWPLEIHLDMPAEAPALDRQELSCPIRYASPRAEIRIRADHLERPLSFSDVETTRVCEDRCAELLERLGSEGGIVESVRRALVGQPGHFPGLDDVARELGISGRSLRRRLNETGSSFRTVMEDVRKGLALDYLQQSTLTVDEIASLLGYSDTPNFYRAFQRWTGRPPSAYR